MLGTIRRKLTRASSVLNFHQGAPASDPTTAGLFDRLDALVKGALGLVGLRTDRDNEARQLTARAQDIRRHLQTGLLRLFYPRRTRSGPRNAGTRRGVRGPCRAAEPP